MSGKNSRDRSIFSEINFRVISKSILSLIAFSAFFLLFPCLYTVQAADIGVEKQTILSASEKDYPPYCIVDKNGNADGFSVELLRAALKVMGRDVSFKTGPTWSELKQDLAEGRLQVLPLVGRTPEREAIYDFTFPYLTMHGTIVVRKGNKKILSLDDLKGKRVAVLKGDNSEEFVNRIKLNATITATDTYETALRELSEGKHDAVVIQRLLFLQLVRQYGFNNLVCTGPPIHEFKQKFCFAVKKGDSDMLALLNEGLSVVMADGTFRSLHEKWFSEITSLLRRNRNIIVGGDNDFPPYEFLDEKGNPTGFNVELTLAIARQMGMQVEIRLDDWNKILKKLKSRELDAVQGMFYSSERERIFNFSQAYTRANYVVAVRKGSPEINGHIDGFKRKSIIVQKGDIIHDWALKQGLEKQIMPVVSQELALKLLSEGKYDCALVAKIPALYWIRQHGWRNLKVGTKSIISPEYCFAVPPGNPDLIADFSEGLAALEKTGEYRKIREKWLSPVEDGHFNLIHILKYSLLTIAPLLILLLAYVLWSFMLRRQVVRATMRYKQSEESYRNLFESAKDGILLIDFDTGLTVNANRSMQALIGYSSKELSDKHLWELGLFKDIISSKNAFLRLQAQSYVHYADLPLKSKDGKKVDVELVGNVYEAGGKKFIQCNIRDISDRKLLESGKAEIEEQNRQLQKNESLRCMAGSVAHHFNNQLSVVMGYLEMAIGELPPDFSCTVKLKKAIQAARDASSVSGLLLTYLGQVPGKFEPVDLSGLCRKSLPILQSGKPEYVQLETDLPSSGPWINADSKQIQQILSSLLINAWEAIGDKAGTIRISVKTVSPADIPNSHRFPIDCHLQEQPYACMEVADSGCGIEEKDFDKLFDPFYSTKFTGRGLGLSVILGIVKTHNAIITVESVDKGGSVFRVFFPLSSQFETP